MTSSYQDHILPSSRMGRLRQVPFRFIIPNLITLLALCLGLTSIRFAASHHFDYAILAIVGAAILDGLDGRIARALRSTSRFGAELDSLADFIDFGVAPAMLLWFWGLDAHPSIGWLAVMIFAMATALRLARFNVALEDPTQPAWKSNFFVGMPAPAGGIIALLPIYLDLAGLHIPSLDSPTSLITVYVLIVAFLMISPIPHFSGKNIGRVPRERVVIVLFGIMTCVLLAAIYPMQMLALVSLGYLCLIPLSVRRYRDYEREELTTLGSDAP